MHNQPFCFQLTQTMLKHVHYYRISMFWFRERCTRVRANTVFVEPLWRLICSLRHQSITTTPCTPFSLSYYYLGFTNLRRNPPAYLNFVNTFSSFENDLIRIQTARWHYLGNIHSDVRDGVCVFTDCGLRMGNDRPETDELVVKIALWRTTMYNAARVDKGQIPFNSKSVAAVPWNKMGWIGISWAGGFLRTTRYGE